jgi:hypothetical protein
MLGTPVLFAAIAITALAILLLGLSDPKRDRRRRNSGQWSGRSRGFLTLLALLPGGWFIHAGNGAYFLMWFGAATIMGWVVALVLGNIARVGSS